MRPESRASFNSPASGEFVISVEGDTVVTEDGGTRCTYYGCAAPPRVGEYVTTPILSRTKTITCSRWSPFAGADDD